MTIRILLLGDSGVGKTSLMLRYTEDHFSPNLLSTAGVDFKVRHLDINGRRVRCQIWDTAGQEKFHVITRAYYRGAHGIALVYDVADADSFKNVNYWVANIQTHAPAAGREGICKVLLGNKVDLPAEHREVSSAAGNEVGEEFGVRYFEVSAKDGTGVQDAFDTLAREIVEGLEQEAAAAAGAGGVAAGAGGGGGGGQGGRAQGGPWRGPRARRRGCREWAARSALLASACAQRRRALDVCVCGAQA
ncbi:ras family-domain-containing protein [Tribonema minus]|uniref:Ras family-domain-containing protein n=1 Tax=Tribonema minus TaxID=303371 RepID=A0A836C8W2_9STRA|nr:ras family-domain-containing protein [Tribonema minus]